jgi:hypothetical protein
VHISSRLGIQNNPIEKPDIRKQIYPCQNITYFLAKAEETIYDYAPPEIIPSGTIVLRYSCRSYSMHVPKTPVYAIEKLPEDGRKAYLQGTV